jgi:NDP-sugar pyrophosphorylase family protein
MRAMILAAGLGTRLRPLTEHRPKALVEVGGRTLLEITLSRLRVFGVREVIINVHHCAEMVLDYLRRNHNFGMQIEVSREDVLLDTGGGLKKAAYFFLQNSNRLEESFILHNVDVISTIDLQEMVRFHVANAALATLAVQERETSRYLLFDEQLRLCGRQSGLNHQTELACASPKFQALGFTGIHVVSPRLLTMIEEQGPFSIISTYLRLAARKESVIGFRADKYYWRDLGTPESVTQAAEELKQQIAFSS